MEKNNAGSHDVSVVPQSPDSMPTGMRELTRKLGSLWAESSDRPRLVEAVVAAWDALVREWAEDPSLPLLIRKSSGVRGSEVLHRSGRRIIVTDNSPAQWACHLALGSRVPSLSDIRDGFEKDTIPIAFAHKKEEKERRRYHKNLGAHSINKAGWKLCHIVPVGLNKHVLLAEIDVSDLKKAFVDLMSPSNYFLLPIKWGGLGEVPEFVEGFLRLKP